MWHVAALALLIGDGNGRDVVCSCRCEVPVAAPAPAPAVVPEVALPAPHVPEPRPEALPKNALAFNIGFASAVGEIGVTYMLTPIAPFEIEIGVGRGYSGTQLSFMGKLTFGSRTHRATTGIGIASTVAPSDVTRNRLSELRHDLLHIRRTLAPTRDAVRRVVDNVIEVREGEEVFPHQVEIAFNGAYDKLLRAYDGLELSRDLIASVRDYLQAKIANDQNEVMKTLTVIASLLLLPTFIVGLYGQNFQHHFPELHWQYGYLWSWFLIVATTCLQLWFFRRKKWI